LKMKFVLALLALASAALAVDVFMNTDNIYDDDTDQQMMEDIAAGLRNRGYTTRIGSIGPNSHYSEIEEVADGGIFMPIFGGACAGTLMEMYNRSYSTWYFNNLDKHNAKMVIAFLSPPSCNIHDLPWLPRAHDDDFSPSWFIGVAYPEQKCLDAGFGVVIGASAAEIAAKFPGFKNPDPDPDPDPVVDIDKAIDEVGHLAERVTYSSECQTHDCVAEELTGDCWGMSDYIACELQKRGVETKILEYGTEYSSNHHSVKYKDADGDWVRFPYRSYNIEYLFRDTDGVDYGHEFAKTC